MPGYTAGVRLPAEGARKLADELMARWLSRQPAEVAGAWARERDAAGAAAPAQAPAPGAPSQAEQPAGFSARDFVVWQKELDREVAYGNQIFHDDKLAGSPEGIACAMCHPNASNTHPETYPKFQTQLKRVALLRDKINWCIENPLRGKKLADDDPKLRALEMYILSQRKGVVLEPGKH
jgi:cytochrome c